MQLSVLVSADKDDKLMINVNVSYATVAEREDGLGAGQISDIL